MTRNKNKANFFIYPHNRKEKQYPSSIRPHIIQQHFTAFPYLQRETIFYHDSDIIFRALPHFETMLSDNVWYVSDTRSYLESQYIERTGGSVLLKKMCATVGIAPEFVINNDDDCGGAQYLLKNTSIEFWAKMEKIAKHFMA